MQPAWNQRKICQELAYTSALGPGYVLNATQDVPALQDS